MKKLIAVTASLIAAASLSQASAAELKADKISVSDIFLCHFPFYAPAYGCVFPIIFSLPHSLFSYFPLNAYVIYRYT